MSGQKTASTLETKTALSVNLFNSHDKSNKEKDSGTSKDVDDNDTSSEFSSLVAAHYNFSEKSDFLVRDVSRIYHLRNFNNWVKSLLISESVSYVYDKKALEVLDMCCGKGGDFFKWLKAKVKYLVCTDIAESSLEEYKNRIRQLKEKWAKNNKELIFDCHFIPADCTRVRLRSKFRDSSIKFDLVSCQFSFHYCFESLPQAECMLKNASECLKTGGLFIGTLPNAYEMVKKIRQSETNSFKNDVCSVEMYCSEPYSLFGAKYHFKLDNVVNCPEFLVHFPTFERLARKFGLKLVKTETFSEFFEKRKNTYEGYVLLKRLKALETYPGVNKKQAGSEDEYLHAKAACEKDNVSYVGTLSKSEWEVITLYQTFVFEKMKVTYDSNGYPLYE